MAAQTYNFPTHTNNDTFNGVLFEVLVNAVPADLTGATIKMQLKDNSGKSIYEFSTTNNKLEIVDAAAGKFSFKKQVISVSPFRYKYDIQITFSNGDKKTWIKGEWTISKDVTSQ